MLDMLDAISALSIWSKLGIHTNCFDGEKLCRSVDFCGCGLRVEEVWKRLARAIVGNVRIDW